MPEQISPGDMSVNRLKLEGRFWFSALDQIRLAREAAG